MISSPARANFTCHGHGTHRHKHPVPRPGSHWGQPFSLARGWVNKGQRGQKSLPFQRLWCPSARMCPFLMPVTGLSCVPVPGPGRGRSLSWAAGAVPAPGRVRGGWGPEPRLFRTALPSWGWPGTPPPARARVYQDAGGIFPSVAAC